MVLEHVFIFMTYISISVLSGERYSFNKLRILVFLEVNIDSQGWAEKQMCKQVGFSYWKWLPSPVGTGFPSSSAEMCVAYHSVSVATLFLALRIFNIRTHNLFRGTHNLFIRTYKFIYTLSILKKATRVSS